MSAWEEYESAAGMVAECLHKAAKAATVHFGAEVDYYHQRADVYATLALAHATAAGVRPCDE